VVHATYRKVANQVREEAMTGSSATHTLGVPGGDPGPAPGPLVISEDERLLESVRRLCAAAGAEPRVRSGAAPPTRREWEGAPLVLLGDDAVDGLAAALTGAGGPGGGGGPGIGRRPGVLLLGRDLDDPEVWRRAVLVGAEHVIFLPDAEPWLLDRIADAAEGVGPQALTVAVLGGRGGAGASTLACALAVTAARSGLRTVLVDADPLGGGLDLLLGGEAAEGLRWPDLAGARGRVNAVELEHSLPRLHALAALSWDRGAHLTLPPAAMRPVVGAARRRGGVVVLDLPRRIDDAAGEALDQADLALLVVPAELRALAAAGRVAAAARMRLTDLRAVVRGPSPSGLDGADVARGLGVPLAGELAAEPGLAADLERGRPPGIRPRGPLARFCAAFLEAARAERQAARSEAGAGLRSGSDGGRGVAA
jgi:secretion/DNA translocation related CpaE-like protein